MPAPTWTSLRSQADLDTLFKLFGGFHDGCIREVHVWTETSVDSDLSMSCAGDLDTRVRLLIQRQFKSPSAIEMLFEQVTTFHLLPSPDNYDSIILDGTLLYKDDTFYWADSGDWSPTATDRDKSTWIAAKKMSWRDASDWMVPELRYVAKE
jgi:hypothetical protein